MKLPPRLTVHVLKSANSLTVWNYCQNRQSAVLWMDRCALCAYPELKEVMLKFARRWGELAREEYRNIMIGR